MVVTLAQVCQQADDGCERLSGLSLEDVQQLSVQNKDELSALKEAGLTNHYADILFDLRCQTAEHFGFTRMTLRQMVELLMQSEVQKEFMPRDEKRQNYQWYYDHLQNLVFEGAENNWGAIPTDFSGQINHKKWTCRFGKLNYLKKSIPYGVVLRMLELRKLRIFNCFNVIAPVEAWRENKIDIDPILCGTIHTIISQPNSRTGAKQSFASGTEAHFVVAQW